MRIINWVNRLIGKADMTSSVTMLVKGNKNVDVTVKNADGSEDEAAAITIQPNEHETIYLHNNRTAHLKTSKKKKPK
jgi:hypothetical protein